MGYGVKIITLETLDGSYTADYWQAASMARARSHRQLVRDVADMWPELWRGRDRSGKAPEHCADWRRWIRSLDRLSLAVILTQK